MKGLIRYFATQGVFAELVTVGLFLLGIASLFMIQREAFPNVTYDIVTVSTAFPGASPEEVERLVTNPLEQDLTEVDGIKKMQSISTENRSYIILQLDPDQTDEETAKSDIQEVVDRFVDRPEDAEDPVVVSLESKYQPIIEVAVGGDLPEAELRQVAKKLEEVIESIPQVARVNYTGLRDFEILVEADLNKLARYQLTLDNLIAAISGQNQSIPGGSVLDFRQPNKKSEIIIRTVGEYMDVDDVMETVVRANDLGRAVRVKDVAKVTMDFEDPEILYHSNALPSIGLTVLKKEKADAIKLVDRVKEMVEKTKPQLKDGVGISYINDASYYIRRRLKVLSNNMVIGLALVLVILSIALPFRVALITSIGIPFSFFGAILYFYSADYSINLLSMIGLIIVTGMLVDDAVVVTENSVRHLEDGLDPQEAAIEGTNEVWRPVTASVLTTVAAFAPLMMMSGIFGKFVQFIPLGVIVALLISLIECFFVLPHHIGQFVKRSSLKKMHEGGGRTGRLWDRVLLPSYISVLRRMLRFRYLAALGTILLFAGTIYLATAKMKFILFPPEGVEVVVANIKTPVGTPIRVTEQRVKAVEKVVQSLPKTELEDFITKVGIRAIDPNDPASKRGSEYAQLMIYLTPEDSRERKAKEIIEHLRKEVGHPEGLEELAFTRINPGPPVGKPISLGVRGRTYEEILPAVEELKNRIGSEIEGVTDINDSHAIGKPELHVVVDQSEAAAAQLSVGNIGRTVRAAFSGVVASNIRTLDEEIDIRVTLPDSFQDQTDALSRLKILNQMGRLVNLNQVANVEEKEGIAAYEHEGNQRQVRITAEVDETVIDAQTANDRIREMLPLIQPKYPDLKFFFGGEDQDTKESMQSLVRAFLVALFAIACILILIFQNLLQPLLVITTIPLGIISVVWTFFVHGKPLTFLGMLGIIALGGVIVNNSIVFVSFVNDLRTKGLDRFESIIRAGQFRLRPIVLTTLTTVVGLLPTAYGWGGLDPFVVPIALALGWGIFFGSILTTLLFPTYLAILDDLRLGLERLWDRLFGTKDKPSIGTPVEMPPSASAQTMSEPGSST